MNIDADSEPHANSVAKDKVDEKDEKNDVEMKVDEKNEDKTEDSKGGDND